MIQEIFILSWALTGRVLCCDAGIFRCLFNHLCFKSFNDNDLYPVWKVIMGPTPVVSFSCHLEY